MRTEIGRMMYCALSITLLWFTLPRCWFIRMLGRKSFNIPGLAGTPEALMELADSVRKHITLALSGDARLEEGRLD